MFWSLVLWLLESLAYGRAGGGGHYAGGSSHSGGHSYSGGSSHHGHSHHGEADFIYNLLLSYARWAEAHPLIGIPLTLAILYLVFRIYAAGNEKYVSVTIGRGLEAGQGSRLQAGLAALRQRDPGFSPEVFLGRARAAFMKIQQAWCGQDMAPARAFISDGVMERFSIQLAMQKSQGKRDRMDAVQVLDARVLDVACDPQFDTLHVALRASAVDVEVSLKDGSVLGGSSAPQEFTEVWSFLRRPSARTLGKPGLIEGFCPNCGAALEIKDAALCSSCHSWVNSGAYDWVLSEITQACEWSRPDSRRDAAGWSLLSGDDPGLNTQFLEDRASAAFWRWQYALWQSDAGLMRSLAADSFCVRLSEELRRTPSRHEEAAVGGVEVLAVEPGEPFDRAHILVKWSARDSLRRHVLVLGRRHGVKTDERSGLVSLRCPGCGAPPERRDQAQCAYCSHAFNDGSRNWILLEMSPAESWQRPALPEAVGAELPIPQAPAVRESVRPAPAELPIPQVPGPWDAALSPVEALAVLVSAITVDNEIAPQELAFLQSYAKARSIPPDTADRVVAAANAGTLRIPEPKEPRQVRAVLGGLIRMSLADGKVTDQELRLLNSFAASHGLDIEAVRQAIAEERSAMYREAKQALSKR